MAGHTNASSGFVVTLDDDGRIEWPLRQARGHRAYDTTNEIVKATLLTLADKGPIEDKSGRATLVLHKRAGKRSKHLRDMVMNVYTMRLKDMEAQGLIKREVVGKRTRSIALAIDTDTFPAEWAPPEDPQAAYRAAIEAAAPAREHVEESPPEDTQLEPPPPLVLDEPPPDALQHTAPNGNGSAEIDYDTLAAALLAQVIEAATRVAAADTDATDEERAAADRYHYLSVQLVNVGKDRDKARHRVSVLEADIEVLRGRLMSMRVDRDEEKRLREGVEANLSRVVQQLRANGNAAYQLDDHQRRALTRLISEIPVSPHTQRNVQ